MTASHQRTPSSDDVRQHIVQSLFSRYDEQGTAEETLISYVKFYEDEGDGNQKTRYLMLAGKSALPPLGTTAHEAFLYSRCKGRHADTVW